MRRAASESGVCSSKLVSHDSKRKLAEIFVRQARPLMTDPPCLKRLHNSAKFLTQHPRRWKTGSLTISSPCFSPRVACSCSQSRRSPHAVDCLQGSQSAVPHLIAGGDTNSTTRSVTTAGAFSLGFAAGEGEVRIWSSNSARLSSFDNIES